MAILDAGRSERSARNGFIGRLGSGPIASSWLRLDILRVAAISDAQISPSGEWVVYSVATNEGNQTVTKSMAGAVGEQLAANPPTSRQPEQRRNWDGPRALARLCSFRMERQQPALVAGQQIDRFHLNS
jgi:hypothetical protein